MPHHYQASQASLREELYELTEDLIDAYHEQNEDCIIELKELIRQLRKELDLTN